MTDKTKELAAMAEQLSASGEYRVLKRLHPSRLLASANGRSTKLAMFIDVETTGLEQGEDEVIEFAAVPFVYTVDGTVAEVLDPFHSYRQPSKPISAEITQLTGITNEMVAGKVIDIDAMTRFIAPAALILAHNAAFDRPFCEGLADVFSTKPWACSMTQVPWRDFGFEGTKLAYLVAGFGYFYDGHRAIDDCQAGIQLLAETLPGTNDTVLARLLRDARAPLHRIWAINSPFDLKAVLKRRGYRWNGDENGKPRAWYIDISEVLVASELEFLKKEIYLKDVDLPVVKIIPEDRFSDRH